jgi:hypothetical protein
MSGFSRCHRFVLYSWHITVPSVRRRQCSANPDGNAFASGVHCALAIDDQPTRTMSATAELETFFRQRFCICIPRLASRRTGRPDRIITTHAPMRSTSPLEVSIHQGRIGVSHQILPDWRYSFKTDGNLGLLHGIGELVDSHLLRCASPISRRSSSALLPSVLKANLPKATLRTSEPLLIGTHACTLQPVRSHASPRVW